MKSLYTIPEDQAVRFVDGQNGFIIPVARKRREVLAGLSPEGQAAYRLFYDDDAKKLLDQAEGPTELKTLERIFSAYFLTSVGDNAADRLGDLYFELGRFDRAADCWLAILRERPDTDLSPALITVKAALALARAGRRPRSTRSAASWPTATPTRRSSIGGRTAKAAEHLQPLLATSRPAKAAERAAASAAASRGPGARPRRDGPRRLADPVRRVGHRRHDARRADPVGDRTRSAARCRPWRSTGTTLFANYLGHVFAVDLDSGKMLWRSASFHNLEMPARRARPR